MNPQQGGLPPPSAAQRGGYLGTAPGAQRGRREEGKERTPFQVLKGLDLGKGPWITQWQKGEEMLAFWKKENCPI